MIVRPENPIRRWLIRVLGPVTFARLVSLKSLGRLVRLRNPRMFSDHVQARMLFDRDPGLAWTCDKVRMKEHASGIEPGLDVPPVLWFGEDLRGLEGVTIDGRWVCKPNNSSGRVFFGEGPPTPATIEAMVTHFEGHQIPSSYAGEWAYSVAQPGYLIEPLIGEPPLPDYKVFVFWGHAVYIDVHTDRGFERHVTTFDRDWKRLECGRRAPRAGYIARPSRLDDLLAAAEAIAREYEFMRVDFYLVGEHIYFGETTPYPASGKIRMSREFDSWLGQLWTAGSRARVRDLYSQVCRFHATGPGADSAPTRDGTLA